MSLSSRRSKAVAALACEEAGAPAALADGLADDLADLGSAMEPDTHGRSGIIGSLSLKLSLPCRILLMFIMADRQPTGKRGVRVLGL